MATDRATWLLVIRIPEGGVGDFQQYEDLVLRLLPEHDGALEARYRDDSGTFEVHVLSFPSDSELDAYRGDSRRQEALHLFAASGAVAELIPVTRVT